MTCNIGFTSHDYKAGMVAPVHPTSSHKTFQNFSASFPAAGKKDKIEKQIREKQIFPLCHGGWSFPACSCCYGPMK
jgi:hypothetical protein